MVLNRTLEKWFTQPARGIEMNLQDLDRSYRKEAQDRAQAQVDWISLLPETRDAAESGHINAVFFKTLCEKHGIRQLLLTRQSGVPLLLYQLFRASSAAPLKADANFQYGAGKLGHLTLISSITDDPTQKESEIQRFMDVQKQLGSRKKFYHDTYFLLICLLTLFVLFFAAWSAQILSRQISVPISALLGAAEQVRRGDLSHRVRVNSIDELATLVRAFN